MFEVHCLIDRLGDCLIGASSSLRDRKATNGYHVQAGARRDGKFEVAICDLKLGTSAQPRAFVVANCDRFNRRCSKK